MIKSIFEFSEFRPFLHHWITARPKQGWGERQRISVAIGLSPTMVSQILTGEKALAPEQATELGEYLGLVERELDYFLLLVDFDRAGTEKLRKLYRRRIEASQQNSIVLANRMKHEKELSLEAKSIFYSSWIYSGVRNLSPLKEMKDASSIAERLSLPKSTVAKVVEFLLENGLCQMNKDGLGYGPSWTHIPANSPLVAKHHQNWRLKGMQKMEVVSSDNLFFTSALSMSEKVAKEIREKHLPTFIENMQKLITPSPSETVRSFNVDWFEY